MQVLYKVQKDEPDPVDSDSDSTLILDDDIKSPVPAKNKTRGRNKKPNKKRKQKTFVTKTYVLRKGWTSRKSKEQKKKTIHIQVFNVFITVAYL